MVSGLICSNKTSTYEVVGVRDIGYWQGNDGFVTTSGYESGMYADYNCFIYVQYYVSAGNLGYGYDEFVVDVGFNP